MTSKKCAWIFPKKKERNALKDWFSGFIAKPISKVI